MRVGIQGGLACLWLVAGAASAQVYKCVDAAGVASYSQRPCAAGAQPLKLAGESSPPAPAAQAGPDYCAAMQPLPQGEGDAEALRALLEAAVATCRTGGSPESFAPLLAGNVRRLLSGAPPARLAQWQDAWCVGFTGLVARTGGDFLRLRHAVEHDPQATECGRPKSYWFVRDAAGTTLLRAAVAREEGRVRIAEH